MPRIDLDGRLKTFLGDAYSVRTGLGNVASSFQALKQDFVCLIERECRIQQSYDLKKENRDNSMISENPTMTPKQPIAGNISSLLLLTIATLTFITATFDGWLHHHVMSKTKVYYFTQLIESILLLCVMHMALGMMRQRSRQTSVSWPVSLKQSHSWPVLAAHCLSIFFLSADFKQHTNSAGGSEFFQVFVALSIPAVVACSNYLLSQQIRGSVLMALLSSAAVHLIIVSKDRELSMPVSTALCSFIFAIFYALYLVLLNKYLNKERLFGLLYLLAFCQIPLFLILAIAYGETGRFISAMSFQLRSIMKAVAVLVTMAITSFLKMTLMFLLLKISDPLTCLVTMNLTLIPAALIKAFIYKLEFLLATLKLFFFLLLNIVITALKERTNGVETLPSERDGRIDENFVGSSL